MLACGHDAAAQSPFFEDKTIRLVLGFSPGGISDLWGRAISRGMSQHIPGKPNIILQNMPGAGSLTAANYIQRRQAGRADDRLRNPRSLFQSAHRYERSAVQLGE